MTLVQTTISAKENPMHKTMLLACAAAMAVSGAAFAATKVEMTTSADHTRVMTHGGTPRYTPPLAHKAGIPVIYSNFATLYPKGLYNASNGASISGPNTIFGQIWIATAFTPAASATVREVDIAARFINGSKNRFLVGIYADASGIPGTLLWSRKTAFPTNFGDCCAVVTLPDKDAFKVTAGTQYWLAVTTQPAASDAMATWNLNVLDQVVGGVNAQNRGSGWQPGSFMPDFAYGIYGK